MSQCLQLELEAYKQVNTKSNTKGSPRTKNHASTFNNKKLLQEKGTNILKHALVTYPTKTFLQTSTEWLSEGPVGSQESHMFIWGCDYRAQLQYSLKCSLNGSTQRVPVSWNSSLANCM